MGEEKQVEFDKELSAIEARAKTRRQRSILATLVPVTLTGIAVLVFAYDIQNKRAELASIAKQKDDLSLELSAQEKKVEKAMRSEQELESKVEKLRNEKKDLEAYLRSMRSQAPDGGEPVDAGPESVVLKAEGAPAESLSVTPHARVEKNPGGRALDVTFSLDVPESQLSQITGVTYELNPIFYFVKREVIGGPAPRFEATASVYACRSTVLVKITLEGGSHLDLDFDWCRADGWPAPKQEAVLEPVEKPPSRPPFPPRKSPTEP